MWAEKTQPHFQDPLCFLFTAAPSVRASRECLLNSSEYNTSPGLLQPPYRRVCHSAHKELKTPHLEQSYTAYWNVCCGWKRSRRGGKPSVIYSNPPSRATSIWVHLTVCLHSSRLWHLPFKWLSERRRAMLITWAEHILWWRQPCGITWNKFGKSEEVEQQGLWRILQMVCLLFFYVRGGYLTKTNEIITEL